MKRTEKAVALARVESLQSRSSGELEVFIPTPAEVANVRLNQRRSVSIRDSLKSIRSLNNVAGKNSSGGRKP